MSMVKQKFRPMNDPLVLAFVQEIVARMLFESSTINITRDKLEVKIRVNSGQTYAIAWHPQDEWFLVKLATSREIVVADEMAMKMIIEAYFVWYEKECERIAEEEKL